MRMTKHTFATRAHLVITLKKIDSIKFLFCDYNSKGKNLFCLLVAWRLNFGPFWLLILRVSNNHENDFRSRIYFVKIRTCFKLLTIQFFTKYVVGSLSHEFMSSSMVKAHDSDQRIFREIVDEDGIHCSILFKSVISTNWSNAAAFLTITAFSG